MGKKDISNENLQWSVSCLDDRYATFKNFLIKKYSIKIQPTQTSIDIGIFLAEIKKIESLKKDLPIIIAEAKKDWLFQEKNQYSKDEIKTEQQMIDYIIDRDYYSNYYTDNGGISFKKFETLLTFRDKCENKLDKIILKELPWFNWNDYPRLARQDLRAEKRVKNSVIIMKKEYGTKQLIELSYEVPRMDFHGVITI